MELYCTSAVLNGSIPKAATLVSDPIPTPGTWPNELWGDGYNRTAYAATCTMLWLANSTDMYAVEGGKSAVAVFSVPRGAGRFYYVGLDFDVLPREQSWGQLLEAIALKAAATPSSVGVSPSSPPPPPWPPAPTTSGLGDGSDLNTPYVLWPMGRGRASYTSAGATATAALTGPPRPDDPQYIFLCHDLPASGKGAAGPSYPWLTIDLGISRRVMEVRIQELVTKDLDYQDIIVKAELQVRVTSDRVPEASGPPQDQANLLCPTLTTNITSNKGAKLGKAALVVECQRSLVGRYVSIDVLGLPRSAQRIQLCGVDVMGPLPDTYALVSRNKHVCVSSTTITDSIPADMDPSLAVDGLYNDNRDGYNGMCALSRLQQDPFITIDLGAVMNIERVEVTKSASYAHSHQLESFSISASDVNCTSAGNPVVNLGEQRTVCASSLNLDPGSTGVYNCSGIRGRYLTVSMESYYGYLRLCEVDVYARVPGGEPYLFSVHRPVTASRDAETLFPGQEQATVRDVAGLLVDAVTPSGLRDATYGSSDTTDLSSTCAYVTAYEGSGSPWVSVNLGGSYHVAYVQLHFIAPLDELQFFSQGLRSNFRADIDVRLGDSVMDSSASATDNPACVTSAGFFAGLESFPDAYGDGQNVRRYTCGYSGTYVTVATLLTSSDGLNDIHLPPLCEVEVFVILGIRTPIGYLASLARYAAASDGSGGANTTAGALALKNPNYRSGAVAEEDACSVAQPESGGNAFWMVDLGEPMQIKRIEVLPSGTITSPAVNVTVSNDTTTPPRPSHGGSFPRGSMLPLAAAAVTALQLDDSEVVVARYVMVTSIAQDQDLELCQVLVYTAEDTGITSGVGARGARPGVALRRAGGRVPAAQQTPARRQLLSSGGATADAASDAAAAIASAAMRLSAPSSSHLVSSSTRYLGRYAGRRMLTSGVAFLVVDLSMVRSVEVAVLTVNTSGYQSKYSEVSGVKVLLSNSSSGDEPAYCAFSVTISLTIERHVFGCNGAYGRYVIASLDSTSDNLPSDSSLEVYLSDQGSLELVSASRTTHQAGGIASGPGGSGNAVNGYYSSAAVDAAVAANRSGLYFGSATAPQPGPWWAVDLGAALPLAFLEVAAHPGPADGLGLADFEVWLSNYTVVLGTEGTRIRSNLTLAAGEAGRYALGGAVARQLIIRQPSSVTRSLELAQVDVYVDRATYEANANSLLSGKPFLYPDVYDAYSSRGYYNDEYGAVQYGLLAALAADGYADTNASRCASVGPGPGNPWLLVDLGSSTEVDRVELLKAADPDLSLQLDGVDILLGDHVDDPEANAVVLAALSLPQPGAWATFYLPPGSSGRYLVVRRPEAGGAMTLCEVNAYGPSGHGLELVNAPKTLEYMAPEVLECPFKSRPIDNKENERLHYTAAVDAWAVGVLAYELLIGRPPFEAPEREGVEECIRRQNPRFPFGLSELARSFIATALQKDPEQRPTVQQMLAHPFIRGAHATAASATPQALRRPSAAGPSTIATASVAQPPRPAGSATIAATKAAALLSGGGGGAAAASPVGIPAVASAAAGIGALPSSVPKPFSVTKGLGGSRAVAAAGAMDEEDLNISAMTNRMKSYTAGKAIAISHQAVQAKRHMHLPHVGDDPASGGSAAHGGGGGGEAAGGAHALHGRISPAPAAAGGAHGAHGADQPLGGGHKLSHLNPKLAASLGATPGAGMMGRTNSVSRIM